jgi:hypothetical protein
MARDDYGAIVTIPAQEYLAASEFDRYGLAPYLPQLWKRIQPARSASSVRRKYPLFPGYVLVEIGNVKPQRAGWL